jgi:hypothetical protein
MLKISFGSLLKLSVQIFFLNYAFKLNGHVPCLKEIRNQYSECNFFIPCNQTMVTEPGYFRREVI